MLHYMFVMVMHLGLCIICLFVQHVTCLTVVPAVGLVEAFAHSAVTAIWTLEAHIKQSAQVMYSTDNSCPSSSIFCPLEALVCVLRMTAVASALFRAISPKQINEMLKLLVVRS